MIIAESLMPAAVRIPSGMHNFPARQGVRPMKSMFPEYTDLTARVMDFHLQRQNIVSSNLANINTPGYKTQRLEFEQQLQDALGLSESGTLTRTDAAHFPVDFDPSTAEGTMIGPVQPRIIHGKDNVDLDKEMATMAKTSMLYGALSTIIQKNFAGLKQIIQEGGK